MALPEDYRKKWHAIMPCPVIHARATNATNGMQASSSHSDDTSE